MVLDVQKYTKPLASLVRSPSGGLRMKEKLSMPLSDTVPPPPEAVEWIMSESETAHVVLINGSLVTDKTADEYASLASHATNPYPLVYDDIV